MKAVILAATLGVLAASSLASGEAVILESGKRPAALVELFTSQGCSSCPPADRWLSALADAPGLWRAFVPLAWHVDYWDGLGWKDRFASPLYSERQRAYARASALGMVYTPGMLVSGAEWTGWRHADSLPRPDGRTGRLRVVVRDGSARIRFAPGPDAGEGPWTPHLAVLGSGLLTEIPRGENRGRTLREDFVVLGWLQGPPAVGGRDARWELPVPAGTGGAPRRALAVWVSGPGGPGPVQATGGWLK
jgi:hypothetical protein